MSAPKYWMDESRESDPLNSKLLFNRVYEDCNGSPTADANRAFYAVPVEEYDLMVKQLAAANKLERERWEAFGREIRSFQNEIKFNDGMDDE